MYIDEEMARDKGHMKSGLKQVIKGKPEQEGAKIYCRCGPDTGLLHDFEIYQGRGTSYDENLKHLGQGRAIVRRLCENLPENKNYKLFFDNHF